MTEFFYDAADWDCAVEIKKAVTEWTLWAQRWEPSRARVRQRLCRLCYGSPIVAAAGFPDDVPHQVKHALVARVHRLIDKRVAEVTAAKLPLLHAELTAAEQWQAGRFDPRTGLGPELDGMDLDPEPDDASAPFLFTLEDMANATAAPVLPQPPLTREEKERLRYEIDLADQISQAAGTAVCFALMELQAQIRLTVVRYIEPQLRVLLEELSKHLDVPGS
ncbi:spermidine/putrescine ABC transporter substrate-binding protein [Canibacter zhoujuaniae]|uniref:spermidine/putrescine ABC transporter substrate-binding protein n=1 Tax=Canibacter zhoujuaniae TaxID=2708343 RepID=UPI0014215826|nr:spermidine/putrescine ABC transporter substrate-binding protein [Canibacter zhoujuaniae]